jgi:hypothetical protein
VRDIVMSREDSYKLLEETYTNLYESPTGERIFSSIENDTIEQAQPRRRRHLQLPVQLLFQLRLKFQNQAMAKEICACREENEVSSYQESH